MDPSPLEIIESIDMMRVLENGKSPNGQNPYQASQLIQRDL